MTTSLSTHLDRPDLLGTFINRDDGKSALALNWQTTEVVPAGKDLPAWGGTVNLLAETLFPTLE